MRASNCFGQHKYKLHPTPNGGGGGGGALPSLPSSRTNYLVPLAVVKRLRPKLGDINVILRRMHHDDGAKSSIKIFANIFISFIGAGILGMPHAFKEVSQISFASIWYPSNGPCHEHIFEE